MKPDQIFAHWKQIRASLLLTIDKFGEDDLAYKPFEASWSAGQIMLHIANAEEGWFRYVVTRKHAEWPEDYLLENYPAKAEIKTLLTRVHADTLRYLESLDESDLLRSIEAPWGANISLLWTIWHVVEHEIHHRGELSLILGMLGREGLDV